jgi:hypothetical protein
MASGLNKTVIKCIVTPSTSFYYYRNINVIYCNLDNEQFISRLRINLWRLCFVEYNNNHIYIHRVGNKNYIDIDFNLMPDKEQYSSFVMKKVREVCRKDTLTIDDENDDEDHMFYYFVDDYTR